MISNILPATMISYEVLKLFLYDKFFFSPLGEKVLQNADYLLKG